MSDPYYRISANQSEADDTFYEHNQMVQNLKKIAAIRQARARPGAPKELPQFSDIRRTHRFPLKKGYKPIILMANDFIKHTTTTNQFETTYGGDFQEQMYLKINISVGNISDAADTDVPWAFCANFVPALLKRVEFKIQGDTITKFDGDTLFAYSQMFIKLDARAALMRLWRETIVEWQFALAGPANQAAQGAPYVALPASYSVKTPHVALQAPVYDRSAFSVFVPLDTLALARNLHQSFPLSPLYALRRVIEFEYNDIRTLINNVAVQAATVAYVANDYTTLWTNIPAVTSTDLYVNYILVHRDIQRIVAMHGFAYVIRQFETESSSVVDANNRTLSYTKIIEWVAMIARYTYSTTQTATGGAAVDIDGGVGVVNRNPVFRVSPYELATDVVPISDIDVTARGQTFYKNLSWDQVSSLVSYVHAGEDFYCSSERSLAIIPMCQRLSMEDFTGSYNSGYGPNLNIKWKETVFATGATTAGTLTFIIASTNVLGAFRGTATVRYT